MQLSVIIVNFNVKYFLEQCLYSVIKAAEKIDCEIFVVDNHSTDGSEGYLAEKFPNVIFHWNQSNVGFGKASNSVLTQAKGDHVLFLNPDTMVPEDCFINCLAFFKTHPNCGALGVRMLDGSGTFLKESKRGFPSAQASFFKIAGMATLFSRSRFFAHYYAGHLDDRQSNEVDILAGAFMMLSKKAVEATRGFDEDFFMYGEDIDLSYRITKAGMQNFYLADTSIIHFKGESTQKFSKDYVEHFYGAMELFLKKHAAAKKQQLRLTVLAIRLSKFMAGLKKHGTGKHAPGHALKTAVIACQQTFTECIQLLKHANPAVLLVGRITPRLEKGTTVIGDSDHLAEAISKNKIDQVVFCEQDLSFKEIIQFVEQNKAKATFLFHSKGSQSIVGSNDKNNRGIFISFPQNPKASTPTL